MMQKARNIILLVHGYEVEAQSIEDCRPLASTEACCRAVLRITKEFEELGHQVDVVLLGGWHDQINPEISIATVMHRWLDSHGFVANWRLYSREKLRLYNVQPPRDTLEEVKLAKYLLSQGLPHSKSSGELHVVCLIDAVWRVKRFYREAGIRIEQVHGVWSPAFWSLKRPVSQIAIWLVEQLWPAKAAALLTKARLQRTLDDREYKPLL